MMNQVAQLQSSEINFLEVFTYHSKQLNEVHKNLDTYLDQRRKTFPRFFFLSNDELLHLVSEASKHPKSVELHLRKLFENLVKLEIENNITDEIVAIISQEGERLELISNVSATSSGSGKSVETWMARLLDEMVLIVKKSIKDAKNSYKQVENDTIPREKWVMEGHPAQAIALVASSQWCLETEMHLTEEYDDDKIDGLELRL